MSSILVTGAAGFVGRALARTMMRDHHVVSVTRDRTKEPPGHAVAFGDVLDQAFMRRVLADYEVETVFHLAAQSIVSICARDPLSALEIAVMGTARLLQAVRDVDRPIRVVVMTSDKVYGSAPSPYVEATPLLAESAYEVSKASQDMVARMFAKDYRVDACVVRAVNIYGPDDPNESRLIPQTMLRCLRGEPPLLNAGSAEMRRQYVFIEDMVAALDFIARGGNAGEAYCVGAPDEPRTVLQVMQLICEQAHVPWQPPQVKERAPGFHEIPSQAIDGSKLFGLGWEPVVPLYDGLARTLDWYRRIHADTVR